MFQKKALDLEVGKYLSYDIEELIKREKFGQLGFIKIKHAYSSRGTIKSKAETERKMLAIFISNQGFYTEYIQNFFNSVKD